jgi:hypothetical protein
VVNHANQRLCHGHEVFTCSATPLDKIMAKECYGNFST